MSGFKFKDAENIKKVWDSHADKFDEWYKTFEGAVENYVDWELLKKYLPENKNAKILDAAGGTGRITLPLVKMGYSLTLCDISSGMLEVAKKKMQDAKVLNRVKISECDVRDLPFEDETYDFVICWDGGHIEDKNELVKKELIRVTKKKGTISISLVNKWAAIINNFYKNPDLALSLTESIQGFIEDEDGVHSVISEEDAKKLFEEKGIRVDGLYAVCHWMDLLHIPRKIQESHNWDKDFFKKTAEIALKLSKEPSVKGMSKHLVVYGEKI